MHTVNRIELFAKPEVKGVLEELRKMARHALPDGEFAEREAAMLAIFDEAGRRMLEEDLQTMADGFDDRVIVDGIEYKRHEPGTVNYYRLNGVLRVRGHTYRRADIRNGPTVVPLELVAGLAEGATPALAYNVAHGYAQHDMRLHGESLEAAHRTPPPRATLERMAKRLVAAANLVVRRQRRPRRQRRARLLPHRVGAPPRPRPRDVTSAISSASSRTGPRTATSSSPRSSGPPLALVSTPPSSPSKSAFSRSRRR